MQRLCPEEYDFVPRTWILPDEYSAFRQDCKKMRSRDNDEGMFIVKPERGCQGKDIFLTKTGDEEAIESAFWNLGDALVVQEYIQNPLLADGHKFDLRLYVLVTCCDPLRVYLYKDGLVRFCTEPYEIANQANKDWHYMHLTNYSLNKTNTLRFLETKDPQDAKQGSKRSLSVFLEHLRELGHDVDALWQRLEELTVKAMVAVQPLLAHFHQMCRPDDKLGDRSFELLGMDVLVDRELKPWLLEFNHSPSFHCDHVVDQLVKEPLICDTFRLLRGKLEARKRTTTGLQDAGEDGTGEDELTKDDYHLLQKMQKAMGGQEETADLLRANVKEFDMDRPRFEPPFTERYIWVGRSEEETEQWRRAEEENDERNRGNFVRCFPPAREGGEAVDLKFQRLSGIAHECHKKLLVREQESLSDVDENEMFLSDSSDCDSVAPPLSLHEVGAEEESDEGNMKQGEEDGAGPALGWKLFFLRNASFFFTVSIPFPPLMIFFFLLMRRLQQVEHEAVLWHGVCKVVLWFQIPMAALVLVAFLYMEHITAEIMSGKNSIPLDEYIEKLRKEEGRKPQPPPTTSHYCGGKFS
uniref:Tubulin--tyrosine ligase-like protein 9 n=1 Tax=Hanusia phi TaxID=3032 RepID=A0A7S0EEA1_9CRYP